MLNFRLSFDFEKNLNSSEPKYKLFVLLDPIHNKKSVYHNIVNLKNRDNQ